MYPPFPLFFCQTLSLSLFPAIRAMRSILERAFWSCSLFSFFIVSHHLLFFQFHTAPQMLVTRAAQVLTTPTYTGMDEREILQLFTLIVYYCPKYLFLLKLRVNNRTMIDAKTTTLALTALFGGRWLWVYILQTPPDPLGTTSKSSEVSHIIRHDTSTTINAREPWTPSRGEGSSISRWILLDRKLASQCMGPI